MAVFEHGWLARTTRHLFYSSLPYLTWNIILVTYNLWVTDRAPGYTDTVTLFYSDYLLYKSVI